MYKVKKTILHVNTYAQLILIPYKYFKILSICFKKKTTSCCPAMTRTSGLWILLILLGLSLSQFFIVECLDHSTVLFLNVP